MAYPFHEIEEKWQRLWEERGDHTADLAGAKMPFYNLMMFPYPSAEGLHVGNFFAFTGADIQGRFHKLLGYDVFEPIGFDAFGIHSENFALKMGIHPSELVPRNIANFRENQLKRMGAMFDWSRQVNTTDPAYYRWTQWLFVTLMKNGLAERRGGAVNWCPSCRTVLANEQVVDGECERCSSEVVQREMDQWYFTITDFSQRLLDHLDDLDWSPVTKHAQRRWIGRSEGARLDFPIAGMREKLTVFTTRPDTIFGATYMVISPEHPMIDAITLPERADEVRAYREKAARSNARERTDTKREKTGVFTGRHCINPATGEEIPIWVSDYVLITYGTGAIMAVPAHDPRDFEFAARFSLPVRQVIAPATEEGGGKLEEAYTGEGVLISSGRFTGIPSKEAVSKITEWLEKEGKGKRTVQFRLHDWCVSRQRYWGPPIPVIHCPKCGPQPVPEEDLPVLLPVTDDYKPDDSGLSPLARIDDFIDTTCPRCAGAAKRDGDVLDNFLDSAWYFLRYPSPERDDAPFDPDLARKWLPVDLYIGGNEHAVLHLMYTRFICMALHDLGYLHFEEPFPKFRAHGMIIKDGAKMSKSRGNVVNPDSFLDKYGSDTFRMYLMFLGPYTEGGDFRDDGIVGIERFLDRIYQMIGRWEEKEGVSPSRETLSELHKVIRKVTDHTAELKYNTAIAALMELHTALRKDEDRLDRATLLTFLTLLAPYAPHLAEELSSRLGCDESIFRSSWPSADDSLILRDTVTIAVQVNGKMRGTIEAAPGAAEEELRSLIHAAAPIEKHLHGKKIVRWIVVPDRIVNVIAH